MKRVINFEKIREEDGVYFLSEITDDFESVYLKVREKEQRIYSKEELLKLPFASDTNPHKNEWALRSKSFLRFKKNLYSKNGKLNILDLGCGNCWLSGQLSRDFKHYFYCADVNLTELIQGKNVFNSERIMFIYGNIYKAEIPQYAFDMIVVNAAVQYFPDVRKLLNRLLKLIKDSGEIHILDSPFYAVSEVPNAKKRTSDYYFSIGFPEMAINYFHHTYEVLNNFNYKFLYNPASLKNKIMKLIAIKDSPFPWIVIRK